MAFNQEDYLESPLVQQSIPQTLSNGDNTPTELSPSFIFNSCRIPDNIKDLQTFDGNSRNLYDFINNVEEILQMIRSVEGTPYGQTLLRAIRRKIIDRANDMLLDNLTPLNWDSIKNYLIDSFGDKRDEPSLLQELYSIRQYDKSITDYHAEIKIIQSALLHNLLMKEKDLNVVQSKKKLFMDTCLQTFMVGLREPIGSTIRAMQPNNLNTALTYVLKEQSIRSQNKQNFFQGSNKSGYIPYRRNYNRPITNYNYNERNNTSRHYREIEPLGTQTNHKLAIKNNNSNTPRVRFTQDKKFQNKRNNYSNNFRIEEMNNIDTTNPNTTQEQIQLSNIDDIRNFRNSASTHPQGT